VLSASVGALLAVSAYADVQPGDIITKESLDKAKDLISPGVQWCVRHGMTMKIVPYKRIEWDKAFKEATEKYSAQVKLSPDGRSLVDYVAGMPFPNIDPNDPQAALKVMWNYDHKPYVSDDLDLRNFDADTGPVSDSGPMQVERHFLLDNLRWLSYTGRLYVDPKPGIPNTDGVRRRPPCIRSLSRSI
jgi:hypothetical protein